MAGKPSLYFDHIEKEVDCHALMTNAAIDAPMLAAEPPQELPPEMVAAFTHSAARSSSYLFGAAYSINAMWEVRQVREGEKGVDK